MRSVVVQLVLLAEEEQNFLGVLKVQLKVDEVVQELADNVEDYVLGY